MDKLYNEQFKDHPNKFQKSFDNPTVQSNNDVITPIIMKNMNSANPTNKAYSMRLPPYSSEKNSLILDLSFLIKFFRLIVNINYNLLL